LEQDGSNLHEEIKLKAFPYKNCGPQLSITDRKCSLVRSGKKMQKLWTAIFGLAARICSFKAVFSLELRDFDTPSSQTSLNRLEKSSKTEKKRKNTIRRII
jgi:hypothetical protein